MVKIPPRACGHCGSPAKGNPCWWYGDHPKDGGDPPCQLYFEDDERPHRMSWLWWIAAGYLALGVGTTVLLSQTPYADNAWWITTLLWPLFLYALIAG